MAADTGFGTTVTFGTSAITLLIRDVGGPNESRKEIDTSHAATSGGYRTFIPEDLVDGGTVTVDSLYDEAVDIPIDAAAETITVTDPGASTVSFSGFCTDVGVARPYDDVMTRTVTIKVAGAITRG